MTAKIYKPAKTAMQSGKARTDIWVLEFEATEKRKIDPLMGYTSSSDMNSQVRLEFKSSDDAKRFAEEKGIAYSIVKPQSAKRRAIAYSDNFSSDRTLPWTH